MNRVTRSHHWILATGRFGVSILGASATQISEYCELATKAAMDARERDLARRAPRRRALARRPWFSESGRWLYELISNHTQSPSALTVEAP